MTALDQGQVMLATKVLNEYLSSPGTSEVGTTLVQQQAERDGRRRKLITEKLGPAVWAFLMGATSLDEFKPEIDGLNKRNELWGFSGIKGQMFFNLLFNASLDERELAAELQAAIAVPETEEMAKSRIRNFSSYVRRVGDALVEAGGSKHARPKLSSIPYFLSYFWQIQNPDRWPVYYTNSVRALNDLNLYQESDDLAESYIQYCRLHHELREIFANVSGRPMTLYDVEHVWTYVVDQKQESTIVGSPAIEAKPGPVAAKKDEALTLQLPDSYVPPIVAIIPRLAANDPQLELSAKASGISIARALEKSIDAAFTMLGYETTLLGQGSGRVQDGLAISADDSYAVLWDAKARQGGYKMGTDDRTIREYITSQSRELKKRRHLRNLYYFIVSSGFQDDFDDLIRGLKMDTDINEVCLVEADVFVALVDAKLRDPNQLSLGPDGVQRLFCKSGVLNANTVREELG